MDPGHVRVLLGDMDNEDDLERENSATDQIIEDYIRRFTIWIESHPEAKAALEKSSSMQIHNQQMRAHFKAISQNTKIHELIELSRRIGESHIKNSVRISWYIVAYNKVFESYHAVQNKGTKDVPNIDAFRQVWLRDVGQTLDTYHELLTQKHDEENNALKKSIFELNRQAMTDPLTGILNRRGVRAQIDNQPNSGAFILLDLDNFKKVNDQKGHLVGDKMLQELAQIIDSRLRRGDIIGRIGGDEFALWLPLQNTFEISSITKVVKRIVGEVPFHKWNIGISAGVAIRPEQAKTFDDLYAKADEALYNAKSISDFSLSMFGSTESASLLKVAD